MDEDKELEIKNENEPDKLQYKQIVLIVLLTVIMVLASLALSFSAIQMMSLGKNLNYNSIIAIVPSGPDDDDPKPDSFYFKYEEVDKASNGIYIKNMSPTKDEIGSAFKGVNMTFEFKVRFGKKTVGKYYEIVVEKQPISNLDSKYVKIYLESDDKVLPTVINNNGRIKHFTDYPSASIDPNNDNMRMVYSHTITKDDIKKGYKSFVLKMWLAEDAPINAETMDKTYVVKVNVYAKWG